MTALMGASREALAAARDRLDEAVRGLSGDDLTQLGIDLFAVADVLHHEGRLRRTLADPSVEPEARQRLATELFSDRLGSAATEVVVGLVGARWSRPVDLVEAADLLGVQAVLAAAEEAGQLEEVEDELFRFARILDRQSELTIVLADTTTETDARLRLVRDLLETKVSEGTLRLVEQAVRAPRGRRIDRSLEDYVRLAAERRERLIAVVHAAAPLSEDQIERLTEALNNLYGRRMQVQVAVDPQLLGGLSIRVGDEVIEGSVLNRLQQAQRRMAG